jgi:TetR/AcrR family transcriptional regulator
MVNQEKNTEILILEAAREVFIHKGYEGARMQEIADKAGINKALLHYYFRSKDHLFEAVFNQVISSFLPVIKNILEADLPLKQKIELFIETYVEVLLENPYFPSFVIQELNTDPGRLAGKLKNFGINPGVILAQINSAIESGEIIPVKGKHLLVNLLGMCLFPFIARPVVQGMLKMSDENYKEFLEERKTEIKQFVMNAITIS